MHRLCAVIATAVPPFGVALLLGPAQKAEILKHILGVAGWHPRQLGPG